MSCRNITKPAVAPESWRLGETGFGSVRLPRSELRWDRWLPCGLLFFEPWGLCGVHEARAKIDVATTRRRVAIWFGGLAAAESTVSLRIIK
jgi:hypothetical protein